MGEFVPNPIACCEDPSSWLLDFDVWQDLLNCDRSTHVMTQEGKAESLVGIWNAKWGMSTLRRRLLGVVSQEGEL